MSPGRAHDSGEAARGCLEVREKPEKRQETFHGLAGVSSREGMYSFVSFCFFQSGMTSGQGHSRLPAVSLGARPGTHPCDRLPRLPRCRPLRHPETRADLDRCPPAGSCRQRRGRLRSRETRTGRGRPPPCLALPPAASWLTGLIHMVLASLCGGEEDHSVRPEEAGADVRRRGDAAGSRRRRDRGVVPLGERRRARGGDGGAPM